MTSVFFLAPKIRGYAQNLRSPRYLIRSNLSLRILPWSTTCHPEMKNRVGLRGYDAELISYLWSKSTVQF